MIKTFPLIFSPYALSKWVGGVLLCMLCTIPEKHIDLNLPSSYFNEGLEKFPNLGLAPSCQLSTNQSALGKAFPFLCLWL